MCQGAALHYVDKRNGVKDLDIWFFFKSNNQKLPPRMIINGTFNNEKFKNVRIDILFRDFNFEEHKSLKENIESFLNSKNKTPKELRKKPFIVLYPPEQLGENLNTLLNH